MLFPCLVANIGFKKVHTTQRLPFQGIHVDPVHVIPWWPKVVYQNNETVVILVYQKTSVEISLHVQTLFFPQEICIAGD